jgi:hypothetical protein
VWTVELTADYRGPRGRIVTDLHRSTAPNITAAVRITSARWQIVGRRRGTTLHARYTADNGQVITRTIRQE